MKRLLTLALRPLARLHVRFSSLGRVWSHAQLAARIQTRLDPSVVLLGTPEVQGTGRISFGQNLYLYRELYFETQDRGEIRIGNNVVMSRGVHIVAFSRVTVGDGTMIGEYTSIRDANHRHGGHCVVRDSRYTSAPIKIGRNVWIGRGVTILPGVVIGDDAVVGANAVVTKNVPAGTVAVGIPARALAERVAR